MVAAETRLARCSVDRVGGRLGFRSEHVFGGFVRQAQSPLRGPASSAASGVVMKGVLGTWSMS
jgi:hypothetical protein